ncbi:MAG: DUF3152 domain-containing protein [Bifidobacterium sp.]|nr:DUF3152 domain-containing protein [Bifidobacterium sp.]
MAGTHAKQAQRRKKDMRQVYLVRRIVVALAALLFVAMVVLSVMGAHHSLHEWRGRVGQAATSAASFASVASGSDATDATNTGDANDSKASRTAAKDSKTTSDSSKNADSDKNKDDNQTVTDPDSKLTGTKATEAIAAQSAALTDEEKAKIMQEAEQTAKASGNTAQKMTYCIATKGDVGSSEAFANTVYRTLNSTKGWPRAGVVFEPTSDTNACDVTLTLSAPDQVTTFSTMCSAEYSCRVGSDVIINKKRWDNAVDDWLNASDVTLADYRTMVINHEVGHALGHIDNEQTCSVEGAQAPLMQEQSMSLRGCKPNIEPLDSELWTTFQGTAL